MRITTIAAIASVTIFLGSSCAKPNPMGPEDYFGRQQFDLLESKTTLYSYGIICGFLKEHGEMSPPNSMGWWHYGPYTLSDESGDLIIKLNSPPGYGSARIEITATGGPHRKNESIYLYFDPNVQKLLAARDPAKLGITCELSESDLIVSRTVRCINKFLKSKNATNRSPLSSLAR